MNKDEFLSLLDRYNSGQASAEEIRRLLNYYYSFQESDEWNEAELGKETFAGKEIFARLEQKIKSSESAPIIPLRGHRWKYIAAACVVVLITGTIIFFNKESKPVLAQHSTNNNKSEPIAENEVVLTTADGKRVYVDKLKDGVVSAHDKTVFRKSGNALSCESKKNQETQAAANKNVITVPRGRQLQVSLPDGSIVWLNTSSSLTFPSAFTTSSREVELPGEGYFEIKKDRNKPFRVHAYPDKHKKESTIVEVLGTHFNVSAYNDDAVTKTTLIEGSVRIARGTDSEQFRMLKPGEQGTVAEASELPIKVTVADTESVTAWRHGVFNFHDEDIHSIMRELARWYNVDVVYESSIPVRKFSGKFRRDLELSTVLQILEQGGIHFRMEGKKVIVAV